MYTLVRSFGVKIALVNEGLPCLLAFVIAEMFYKFHSFMLETGAFLVTWFVLSWVYRLVLSAFGRRGDLPASS